VAFSIESAKTIQHYGAPVNDEYAATILKPRDTFMIMYNY